MIIDTSTSIEPYSCVLWHLQLRISQVVDTLVQIPFALISVDSRASWRLEQTYAVPCGGGGVGFRPVAAQSSSHRLPNRVIIAPGLLAESEAGRGHGRAFIDRPNGWSLRAAVYLTSVLPRYNRPTAVLQCRAVGASRLYLGSFDFLS